MANAGNARSEWNAAKNRMIKYDGTQVSFDHYTARTFAQGCMSNCLEAVVEVRYTTDTVVGPVGKGGLHSQEGKQLLPGAQCASGGQGQTGASCAAGSARIDHRSRDSRSGKKISFYETELARVELADLCPPILRISESPAVARELLLQLRLLQSTLQIKLSQFDQGRGRIGVAAPQLRRR